MSKHKDKDRERSRDERRSRDRERSRDRDRKRRSRSRSKDRHKRSKDSKRSKEKSSRRDRSKSRERRKSRSRDYSRRSRSRSKSRSHHRRSPTPQKTEVPMITSDKMKHFISASLSGISNQSSAAVLTAPPLMAHVVEPVRTDFSNLFGSSSSSVFQSMAPNASALAIAAAKAKDLMKSKNLSEILNVEKNGSSLTSNGNESSQEASAFRAVLAENENSETGDTSNSANDRKRKKKSRWATSNDSALIPGMPTILPSNLNAHQQEAYLVQLQIEEISRKLRTGDLGIAQNPEERSPSPEPIYSSDGKRLNTREFRTRKKLEEQRHMLIQRMQCMNPDFKPPADYKPPVTRVSDKVLIPQEEHPDINFVGLLIGPRGNTLKAMEKDTGAKIIIRGKGSVKEGKVGRKDGQPLPGEDEPLHAFITASTLESVKKAVEKIKDVIKQGIEVPEGHNDLRRMQLRELAQLNGTLRENDNNRCNNCGSTEHKTWLCPDKPNVTNNIVCSACGGTGHIMKDCKQKRPGMGGIEGSNNQAKIDEEYLSLMAELGEVPPEAIQQQQKPPEPPVAPSKPYSIFDNPRNQFENSNRNQAPRPSQMCAPPPSQPPPPWSQPLSAPPPVMPHGMSHPMGQYPPPMWNANPPLPPGIPGVSPSIPPPPPGTDLSPPGTFGFDDSFGKKPALNSWALPPPVNSYNNSWAPPLPPGPPATSFSMAPPPPPE